MRPQTHPSSCRRPIGSGFTLVELLVSIALVLILILGVNQVFRITTNSIGAGQAMSTVTRDNQAAAAIIYNDLRTAVTTDAPWMMIESRVQAAYRDLNDQNSDVDGTTLTRQLDEDNDENDPLERSRFAAPDVRAHRVDIFNFFSRGQLFRRTTGNDNEFVSSLTGYETWISYGHLRMWDKTGNIDTQTAYKNPGATPGASNPDNFHASKWVLGRTQMLLVNPVITPPAVVADIRDRRGVAQAHIDISGTSPTFIPIPLSQGANTNVQLQGVAAARDFDIQESRIDLAATSVTNARAAVAAYIGANPPGSTNEDWWSRFSYRFYCNPYIAKPHTSRKMAQASPYFIQGCTQFIVEYAGDFLNQAPADGAVLRWYGQAPPIATPNTDGEIDFMVTPTGRKIRWYGMPRNIDTSDDLATGPFVKGTGADITGGYTTYRDVVPLRDIIASYIGGFTGAPFERMAGTTAVVAKANYATHSPVTQALESTETYTCAWGPFDVKPKMIRITMVLDDPNGRLPEGQTYEYVITLP